MDITDQKRSEQKLLNYSILEAKAKEMEQFAYAASHDLREPLLTIQGYVNALDEDFGKDLPDEAKRFIQTISDATSRMDTLIKGMLDYSRLSSIKQLQAIDLADIIAELKKDLSLRIEQTNAVIEVGEMPEINAYPLELKLLLQNLLSNSLKFIDSDTKPIIKIDCETIPDGHQICVADNGIGISDKNKTHIFKLFRTLNKADKYIGTGIGLANVQKIVELHNGEVWVEDNAQGGATFCFTIKT